MNSTFVAVHFILLGRRDKDEAATDFVFAGIFGFLNNSDATLAPFFEVDSLLFLGITHNF